MLVRRIARPLLATWFVVSGLDAIRRPNEHVLAIRQVMAWLTRKSRTAERILIPTQDWSDAKLSAGVRAHGAAIAVAGLAFATGTAPRAAAAVLVGLTVPRAIANLPGVAPTKEEARRRRDRLVQIVSMTGAGLLAAADLEGRPGLRWRWQAMKDRRATARGAGEA